MSGKIFIWCDIKIKRYLSSLFLYCQMTLHFVYLNFLSFYNAFFFSNNLQEDFAFMLLI